MKRYRYSVSTSTIWTSFDYGTVLADSLEDATIRAKNIVSFQLKHANELLQPYCTIDIDVNQVVVVLDEDQ